MSIALPRLGRPIRRTGETRLDWARGRTRLVAALPLLALGLMTLAVFWRDLLLGQAFYGGDTVSYYYPLTAWYAEQLKAGHLPLWIPYMFGGYPLFADGEVGMLYPLNLLGYAIFPVDQVYVVSRALHFWLASVLTYWLARRLGQRRFGATLAGLVFAYSSFLVGHLQHDNILRSAVWLPLTLGLFELAMRTGGRRRLGWLLGCSLVVGLQALGVHVQPVLLSLFGLGLYALAAPLGSRSGGQARWRRLLMARPEFRSWRALPRYLAERLAAVGLVAGLGLGLAAVQLLPLYELGERSNRAGGVSYEFSTSYSVPPTQLVQLVLPYLFRPDQNGYWGLWSPAETTIYLGVVPLMLAMVALAYVRGRAVGFFGLLGGVSLLLAIGDYLPLKLYSLIWSLPGFSFLRVPARFSLLFVLAGAMLAGWGADWLSGRLFDRRAPHQPRPRIRRLTGLGFAAAVGAAALGVAFVAIRAWLDFDPSGTREAIDAYYLSLRRGDLALTASAVYFGVLRSLDLANPRTLGGLLLMVGGAGLLLARGLHRLHRLPWQIGLVGLVVIDLLSFAEGFYPQKPVGQLRLTLPSIRFLAEHNGLQRVFVEPQLYGLMGPNQLVAAGLDQAGGYSSLEPRRATDYFWSVVRQDNVLLDLFNVRYVVSPRSTPGLVVFEGGLFHPSDRLMRGSVGNPAGSETFAFEPWRVEAINVVGSLEGAADLPYGTPIAELVLEGPDDREVVLLRSGVDLGDGNTPLLGPPLPGSGTSPRIVWAGPSLENGRRLGILYGSTLVLERPLMATSLTVRRIGPAAILNLHGLGLRDRLGLPVRSLTPTDRAKYVLRYQDQDTAIYENRDALPRAWLVGGAVGPAASGSVVDQLLTGPFDPRDTILVDAATFPTDVAAGQPGPAGRAEVAEYQPERITVAAESEREAYLVVADRFDPDWRATVDGQPAPILRADGMFRAVPVPAGPHRVELRYEPRIVQTGALVSLASLLALAVLACLCLFATKPGRSPA